MANVVKKYSISYELAQKMVDAAVAKARELGVSENVAILDDGGNLKAFGRMDGWPDGWRPDPYHRDGPEQGIHSSVRRFHAGVFQIYPERPVAFGRHPRACAYGGVGWRVSH